MFRGVGRVIIKRREEEYRRIAAGVGRVLSPRPAPNMFHVEHFAITLYIIRYEFTPPDQFIPYI